MTDRRSTGVDGLLSESHLMTPDDLPVLLVEHGASVGACDVAVYLVDYEQRVLVPLPSPKGPDRVELSIDATVAGRCFRTLKWQQVRTEDGGHRLWVPVVDGTERLGVLELVYQAGEGDGLDEEVTSFASVVAELVLTKGAYGDLFERVKRRRPMSLAAELLWHLLPPLTYGSEDVVITAALVPPYDLGGDAFDYAVDPSTARFAIFDAMGHGLAAGVMATVAMAAYRNSRRHGLDLIDTAALIDDAVAVHVGDAKYVTGVLAELDLRSGRLRWCVAGHPRPLILRHGRIVRTLDAGAHIPFGLRTRPTVGEEALEPGDRLLLYTDGIVEARSESGDAFGVERFADVVSRASSERTPPAETTRRLMHAIVDHQFGSLRDDATALIVQWPGDRPELLIGPDR